MLHEKNLLKWLYVEYYDTKKKDDLRLLDSGKNKQVQTMIPVKF